MHSFHLPGGVAKGTQVYFVKFATYDIVLFWRASYRRIATFIMLKKQSEPDRFPSLSAGGSTCRCVCDMIKKT